VQEYDLYPGDFNGDGKTDILYIAKDAGKLSGIATYSSNGLNTVWQSWPSNYLGIQWYGGAYTAVVGDFNNDRMSDVLLQRNTAGDSFLMLADANGRLTGISQTIAQSQLQLTWSKDLHTILPGDFSGDGRDDLFFQAAAPADLHGVPLSNASGLFTSSPAQTFTDSSWPIFKWSRKYSAISVGDFNGDDKDDLLIQGKPNVVMIEYDVPFPVPIYSPNSFGVVYSQGGVSPLQQVGVQQWSRNNNGVDWSALSAMPVIEDFNGDGRDDVLLQARSVGRSSYLVTGNASGAAFSSATPVATNVAISADSARLVAGNFDGPSAGIYVQATTPAGTNYIATTVGAAAVAHDPSAMVGPVETVTYSYDARGRLKAVVRAGGLNDNVQTQYTYDKANNRRSIVTTGSPNPLP
jgi:hypothetical protein